MRTLRRRMIPLLGITLVCVIAAPGGAAASCGGDVADLVQRMPGVFVGTVVQQSASHAQLDVHEVWRGPDLAPRVVVQTAESQLPWPLSLVTGVSSSNDATLDPGATYVVALEEGALRTNGCLVAGVSDDLLALAPDDVRDPVPGGLSGMGGAGLSPAVALGGAAVLVVVVALVADRFRRRRAAAKDDAATA